MLAQFKETTFALLIVINYYLLAINFKSSVCHSEFLAKQSIQPNAEIVANPNAPYINKTSGLE